MRSSSDAFTNPTSIQDMLDLVEFGTPFYNHRATDFYLRYFHMTSITEDYLVVPLNSLVIDMAPMLQGVMVDTRPLSEVSYRHFC